MEQDRVDTQVPIQENKQEVNIQEYIDKIVEVFNQAKAAYYKLKDSDIKMKDWYLKIGSSESQYNIDFNMKMTIKPQKM